MQCPLEGLPAATQGGQPAATQKSEDCTHCGDTHPTVSIAGSGGVCSEKVPEPSDFEYWKIDLFSRTTPGSPGSSPLGSDGAHLAETQQVVGVPNCD